MTGVRGRGASAQRPRSHQDHGGGCSRTAALGGGSPGPFRALLAAWVGGAGAGGGIRVPSEAVEAAGGQLRGAQSAEGKAGRLRTVSPGPCCLGICRRGMFLLSASPGRHVQVGGHRISKATGASPGGGHLSVPPAPPLLGAGGQPQTRRGPSAGQVPTLPPKGLRVCAYGQAKF